MSHTRYTIGMVLVVALALAGAGLGVASTATPADSGVAPQANGTNGTNATDGADVTNGTDTTNETNATDGTDATNETDTTETTLPPGISEDGVTNASALLDAHIDALAETGYTYTFSQEISFSFGNASTGVGNETTVPGNVTTPVDNVSTDNETAPADNETAATDNDTTAVDDNASAADDNETAAGEPQPPAADDNQTATDENQTDEQSVGEPGQPGVSDGGDIMGPIAGEDNPFGNDILSLTSTSTSSTENGTVGEGLFPSYVVTENSIQFGGEQADFTTEQWATDGVLLTRYRLANQLIFQRVDLTENATDSVLAFTPEDYERTVTKADIVATTLESGDFEVVDAEQTENETLYTLEAVGVSDETMSFDGAMNNSTFNATIVVNQDGLVSELSMDSESFGLSMSADFEVTQRGEVNVTQPDWTRVLLD